MERAEALRRMACSLISASLIILSRASSDLCRENDWNAGRLSGGSMLNVE